MSRLVRAGGFAVVLGPLHHEGAFMGAKYLPTVKDQRANQRFLAKQTAAPKFKNAPGDKPARKSKKK
jgi:hypothetical protein